MFDLHGYAYSASFGIGNNLASVFLWRGQLFKVCKMHIIQIFGLDLQGQSKNAILSHLPAGKRAG